MSKQYETVIGLEVHVELATKTKIFCGCSTEFGGAPNTHTCPVCTGMPGSLPVLNKQVVEYALAVGLATNCGINQYCKFDRKNYFYPDNPQNYQISQLYLPICHDGWVEIDTAAGKKKIGIHEIHMEEDAGKLVHDEWEDCSLVDYNRSGVPLIEIVSEPDMRSADEVIAYLEKHGARCHVQKITEKMEGPYHYTDPEGIPQDTQCIIVLGGDGTLLQAARDVVHLDIPLLGINLGTLGFLAEVDKNSVYPALDRLLSDDYELEDRMMLEGKIYRGEELIGKDIALNDIVIGREGHLRVIRFKNYVNDAYMNSYNADGIIISTPTGSTGYSLSAGGPVVSPSASMMIMTPIAPHTMNTRSIILSGEEAVTVEIGEGRHNTIEKAVASFDGDTQISMVTGDRIVIRKATVRTKILKLNHLSFVEVLRQKMSNS